jgi:hypothetical protein
VNVPGLEFDATQGTESGQHLLQSVKVGIEDWHGNLIRLPVNEDYWFGYDKSPTAKIAVRDAYRALVDQVIQTASDDGAYVMLDLHWSDMGAWGKNNGQHFLPDDHSTLFWQDAATRYANNPTVLYDPYNEPTGIDWNTWLNGGTIDEGGTIYHSPGMQAILDTIRATGANNIVAPEGIGDGDDLRGITAGYALNDSAINLMYQIHFYPAAAQDNAGRDKLVGGADVANPLYVGEWGADAIGGFFGTAKPDVPTWTKSMLNWLEEHQYSWTAWSMNTTSRPCLISDWAYTPTDVGALVRQDLLTPPPTGAQAVAAAGQVTRTWNAAPGAVSYNIYRATTSGAEGTIPYQTGVTDAFSTDTAVDPGTTDYYVITAVNADGESLWSTEVSVMI